jgi:glycosyltransferase involved in cell wall biosynthesis
VKRAYREQRPPVLVGWVPEGGEGAETSEGPSGIAIGTRGRADPASSLPRVGVVVPTLQVAETIEWTLASLRASAGCDVSILVVDGGSTDGTLEICRRLGVDVLYEPPGSIYRAINLGIQRLDAPWVTYLNGDDLVYPTGYASLVKVAEASSAAVAYGRVDFMDAAGRFLFSMAPPRPSELSALFARGVFALSQPGTVIRRASLMSAGGLDEKYRCAGDADLFARLVRRGDVFALLGGPAVAAFRIRPGQLGSGEAAARETRALAARESAFRRRSDSLAVLRWRLRNLPDYVVRVLRTGNIRSARGLT